MLHSDRTPLDRKRLTFYPALAIQQQLIVLHEFIPPKKKFRLDDIQVLPAVALRDCLHRQPLGSLTPHPFEPMVLFEFLARVIDPYFQAEAAKIAAKHKGSWQSAPPKNSVRMSAKLADDHLNEMEPKVAANIDMSRYSFRLHRCAVA